MTETFSDGDVVQLKSGGPPMTIGQVTDKHHVNVAWMDAAGNFHATKVMKTVLRRVRNEGTRNQ